MVATVSRPEPSPPDRERRLDEAIAEYLLAAEAGRAPDRREFLARYPDLAGDLASFFDDEDCVRRLAGTVPMPGAALAAAARRPPRSPGSTPTRPSSAASSATSSCSRRSPSAAWASCSRRGRRGSAGSSPSRRSGRRPCGRRPAAGPPTGSASRPRRSPGSIIPGSCRSSRWASTAGYPFLCLRLIEGGDLERHLHRFRDDPVASARLIAEIAHAVHYAHQRGVLHRDLKPSNILLDAQGRPHVTDFGLARCLEDDSRITQTGLILGTPSYMAPEQVSGPRNEVTTAADVYGLGAVLYTLLAGRPPFKGDSVYETLRQVREQEPALPASTSPGVDRDLEAICLKCLEKDPRRRYPSAEALAAGPRALAGRRADRRAAGRSGRAGLAVVSQATGCSPTPWRASPR